MTALKVKELEAQKMRLQDELRRCQRQLREAIDDRERFRKAYLSIERELADILAPALGYPPYEPGSPGYHPRRIDYDIGDHTGLTLAEEAAKKLAQTSRG